MNENERISGYDKQAPQYDTIPPRGWSDPSRREAFEQRFGTPLGKFGYEFGETQYKQLLAVEVIASAVAASLNTGNDNCGLQIVQNLHFDEPDGSFSGGVLLFGAPSRDTAEYWQPHFADRVNDVLENLEANVRLGENTQ